MEGQKIIAFYSPYPGAGKSTAAKYLDNPRIGCSGFQRLSFADPLYWMMGNIFLPGVRYMDKDETRSEIGEHSLRELMIAFGQAGKSVWPDIWVEFMRQRLYNFDCVYNYVIDDLRFPNEYRMLREEGAKIVRITNPGREIVPSETEGLLERYHFDAEVVNRRVDRVEYIEQINEVVKGL